MTLSHRPAPFFTRATCVHFDHLTGRVLPNTCRPSSTLRTSWRWRGVEPVVESRCVASTAASALSQRTCPKSSTTTSGFTICQTHTVALTVIMWDQVSVHYAFISDGVIASMLSSSTRVRRRRNSKRIASAVVADLAHPGLCLLIWILWLICMTC